MKLSGRVCSFWAGCVSGILLVATAARAQQALPPLPPPSEPPEPRAVPAPPTPRPVDVPEPPRRYAYALPPRGPASMSSAEVKHAPAYSLWLGGGLGVLVYGGGLYNWSSTTVETTGDLLRPGLALQGDIGARLGHRYIPYLTLELGLMGAGRRFDGSPGTTNASTSFLGAGFRYLMGDVDSVSFLADISFGWRKFQVSNASGTWSAGGFEILRLGFGVDVRSSTRVTVSPLITISGGTLTDTSGNIAFAPNQPDGQTNPPFVGNMGIPSSAQTTYFTVVIGCDAHVDLFGK